MNSGITLDYPRSIWTREVFSDLPEWVSKLIPTDLWDSSRNVRWSHTNLIRACVLAGTLRKDIKWGQVSFIQKHAKTFSLMFTSTEALAMQAFAKRIHVTEPSNTVRTALMNGMKLPHVEDGVMSCTRENELSYNEWQAILFQASKVSHRFK